MVDREQSEILRSAPEHIELAALLSTGAGDVFVLDVVGALDGVAR